MDPQWKYFDKWNMVEKFDILMEYNYGNFEYIHWRYSNGKLAILAPKGYNQIIYKLTNHYIDILKSYLIKNKTSNSIKIFISNNKNKENYKEINIEEILNWREDFYINIKYKPTNENVLNDIKPYPIFKNKLDIEFFYKNDI